MRPILLATLLALTGCSLLGLDDDADYEDVYAYTAYDDSGQAVVTGTIRIVYLPNDVAGEPDHLQGRWELDVDADYYVGPQDGEGDLSGTATGDTFSINLNSGLVDSNVFLSGRFEEERARMEGEWSYSNIAGPAATGTFEAVRTREATRHHVAG